MTKVSSVGVGRQARGRPRLFFGWYVVAAAAVINVYGAGVWFYGFPIFYKALLDEFAWSAAAGAAIISLSRLEGGLEAPIIGWLVDRFGPRLLGAIGALITAVGFLAMSRVDAFSVGPVHVSALVAFAILYAGWMSIGYNTGFGHASQAAVNAWFARKRSRAFALFSLGSGGSGLIVFALGWLVSAYGWRWAAFWSGVGIVVFVLPLTVLLRHRPEQYGYLPDGEEPSRMDAARPARAASSSARTPPGWFRMLASARASWHGHDFTVKEALKTSAFWMLALGSAGRSIAMTSIVIHEVKYLTDERGVSLVMASTALGAMVTVSLAGRLGMGFLGDYVEKRFLMCACYLTQALGIYILATADSMPKVWLFVVVYAIGYGGAIPLYSAIVGEYFGRKHFATVRGFLQFFLIPATVVGPPFAGWVYDTTDSYVLAFNTFIVALLLGTVFMFLARRPRDPSATLVAG